MGNLRNMNVGDRITINPGRNQLFVFRTVKEVHKNGVVDNTGQKWSMSGDRWGCRDHWNGQTVQPFSPSHEEWNDAHRKQIEHARKANALSSYRWRDASEEVVAEAYKIIDRIGGT